MATNKEKLATIDATDNANNNHPEEENPRKDVDSTDGEQNFSVAVDSAAAESKKDSEGSKTTVSTVSSLSPNDGLVSKVQKKVRRAERFGMPVQLSEEEKRNSRAERFGTVSKAHGSEVSKTSEELKRKARAERFGLAVPSSASDEEAKRKARLARFAPYPKTDAVEEDKRKARAIRFSETPASSLSQANGKGNIEPKAAITGKLEEVPE